MTFDLLMVGVSCFKVSRFSGHGYNVLHNGALRRIVKWLSQPIFLPSNAPYWTDTLNGAIGVGWVEER
ncbi:hypothetical protein [Okeania sp. SIO2C2]|uniref:hypothetical protein n=1 Tax=Okeania sp. SIO2C2 TaxID=2607787 RepID=UPI002580085F|nr:hypothetical protein [Okeania sp. SIO2C2]